MAAPGYPHTASVQIVEDDKNIANLLAKYLQRAGFDTLISTDGQQAITRFDQSNPDLVVLDVMLPGKTGWQICDHIRSLSDTPILMLTACSNEEDRIRGFSQGVDDYVTKPFSPREVVERVKAILRRTLCNQPSTSLRAGKLCLDTEKHTVTVDTESVNLTTSEFELLQTLMSRPGRVFTRDELLERINAHETAVIDRVIDVHIGNLRQKIESSPALPYYVMTKRGVGYYFNDSI